ncbi:energy transducer TonB family protein [Mucilaginibacter jinjuensis]|uniref:Carboxypeptidase-like regulatory domain-containing protein n=1 Tax=Mucilaginibacter jinjuensis TaxID=1176721 RepID=A0ABY7T6W7_9SPHI|nr:carboxypeptidase-like regulatory domain-containing protein [Mucilaginibacter jinjuensis]WCT12018.1 carboxypeptidase-like regulatory domain-containing protein [Mucilaginibacter jinjuensis]
MSTKKTDISQIRKYLNGELDARAMHKLEREAQDDPFLMDALEGYAGKKDQQANLNELQKRLNHRIGRGNKKIVALWPLISIAATVLVMLGIGTWWLIAYQPSANKTLPSVADKTVVAMVPAPPQQSKSAPAIQAPVPQHHELVKQAPLTSMATVASAPASVESDANAEIRIDEPVAKSDVKAVTEDSATKDAMLKEVIITGYATQRKKDVTGAVSAVQSTTIDTQLQNRVAGVEVKTPNAKDRFYNQLITGRVISADDSQPLPGVSVSVLGKNRATMTDANGYFKMEAGKNDNLKLGYVGYESKEVKVKGDSINVALKPSSRSLSEVVVTGYGAAKDIIEEAHPRNGWDSFKKYLADASSPDHKIGKVRVRFVVNTDNTLTDFKVTKSLSPDADAEAIRLIKEGPAWIHNVNGEPETVTVTIKFK